MIKQRYSSAQVRKLKMFVVWWGHVLAPSIQASVKFCNFGNFIILWRSFQWFRRIFPNLSVSKVKKTVERYIAMRHSRDSWSYVIWSLTCGSLLEVVVFPSYLPMYIDLEESTVEPRYNEGWKFRRSRLFFIYFRASYNLVKRKESAPCVVLATCKVAGPSTSISKKVDRIPYYLSGLSRALFSDNLSRNSCILVYIAMVSSLTSVCASRRQHRRVSCFGHISYRSRLF